MKNMAWAICLECGFPVHWPKRRFSRLSDYSCPNCGGKLKEVSEKVARERAIEHGGFYSFYSDRWVAR